MVVIFFARNLFMQIEILCAAAKNVRNRHNEWSREFAHKYVLGRRSRNSNISIKFDLKRRRSPHNADILSVNYCLHFGG